MYRRTPSIWRCDARVEIKIKVLVVEVTSLEAKVQKFFVVGAVEVVIIPSKVLATLKKNSRCISDVDR
jgi:hypothetical protein